MAGDYHGPGPLHVWQSMDTAPKDGRWILVVRPVWASGDVYLSPIVVTRWQEPPAAGWLGLHQAATAPTHWMPIPDLPRLGGPAGSAN